MVMADFLFFTTLGLLCWYYFFTGDDFNDGSGGVSGGDDPNDGIVPSNSPTVPQPTTTSEQTTVSIVDLIGDRKVEDDESELVPH